MLFERILPTNITHSQTRDPASLSSRVCREQRWAVKIVRAEKGNSLSTDPFLLLFWVLALRFAFFYGQVRCEKITKDFC